jgi:hypothetical protein
LKKKQSQLFEITKALHSKQNTLPQATHPQATHPQATHTQATCPQATCPQATVTVKHKFISNNWVNYMSEAEHTTTLNQKSKQKLCNVKTIVLWDSNNFLPNMVKELKQQNLLT